MGYGRRIRSAQTLPIGSGIVMPCRLCFAGGPRHNSLLYGELPGGQLCNTFLEVSYLWGTMRHYVMES